MKLKEEISGIENEIKEKKNISDLKIDLENIDLSKKDFIKIDKKNNFDYFDWLVKYNQSAFKKTFHKIKHFFIEKDILSKIIIIFKKILKVISKIIKKITSKIKWNKLFLLVNEYKKVYFRFYLFIISIFILLCFVFVSKLIIENKVNSGYQNLIEIKNTRDEKIIKDLVKKSIDDFRLAWVLFYPFSIIPTDKIDLPKHVIYWWRQIAYTINNLIKVYNNIDNHIKKEGINNLQVTSVLTESKDEVFAIESDLKQALDQYNSIKDLEQGPLNSKFEIWKKYLNNLEKYLLIIKNNYQTFLNILWDKKEKKYLIVFQNADEIRPTGWFMWSMGIVSMYKWKITKFEPQDVYTNEWNLKKEDYLKLRAPEWLNTITKILGLRDSNYSQNYDTSSENIRFFMEKIWYNLDWIVYINNTIIEDFLRLTWNISFTKIDENIRHNNFSAIMSLLVESKKFKNWSIGTPKQILFDFIEEFKARLIKDWNYLSYFKIISDNIIKREIVVYSFSSKENQLLQDLDINWNIDYNSSLDFSYPVYTSISWNKSDRYMARKYEKNIKENKDCSIDTSLKISLSHNLTLDNEAELKDLIKKYEIKTPWTMYIQWTWRNRQYVRVLLPKNAIIKENKIYKIEETPTVKYVNFYMQTERFQTKSVTINYTLPNKKCKKYSFNLYKQAWVRKYDVIVRDDDVMLEKKNVSNDFSY